MNIKKININNERDRLAIWNIIISFINKGASILISFLLVSSTIDYLDSANYGVWLTLSSVVIWAGYFDLGIQHGFRNHLTRAFSNQNIVLEKQLVSTAYMTIFLVFLGVLSIFSTLNHFFDWSHFLNLSIENSILKDTFYVLIFFFSLQSVLNLIQTILAADQRPAYGAMIYTIGQLFALIGINILIHMRSSNSGSLIELSYVISGVPIFIFFFFSVLLFKTKYRYITPSLKFFRKELISSIFGLGIKFFVIQLSLLIIFQSASIIITRNLGPESTTIYNVAYKYLGITYMVSVIVLTPFWSAFTDAYEKRDFRWMKKTYNRLNKLWILVVPTLLLLVLISDFVYKVGIFRKYLTNCLAIS